MSRDRSPPARTVVFDLDGTLTDPFEGITRCHLHALERLGVDPLPAQRELARFIGPPLRQAFGELLGARATPDEIERAVGFYRERFATIGLFENRVYEGVDAMLGALGASGATLLIATSKPSVFAVRIVERFGLAPFFSGVFGSELDGRHEDKSELLRHVVELRGLDPQATWMVGDREHDVRAAKRTGVGSVGVTWGYGSAQELRSAGADVLCDSPAAVARALATEA